LEKSRALPSIGVLGLGKIWSTSLYTGLLGAWKNARSWDLKNSLRLHFIKAFGLEKTATFFLYIGLESWKNSELFSLFRPWNS